MAAYFSTHPSDSKREKQIKEEELWNNWFTVNENKCDKPLSDEKNGRNTSN